MALALLDPREVLVMRGRHRLGNAELHELGVAGDRVEWRSKLVTHRRQEITLRAIRDLGRGARRFGGLRLGVERANRRLELLGLHLELGRLVGERLARRLQLLVLHLELGGLVLKLLRLHARARDSVLRVERFWTRPPARAELPLSRSATTCR